MTPCGNPDPSTVLPGDGTPRACTRNPGHDGWHANSGNAWAESDAAERARAERLAARAEDEAGRGWQAARDRRSCLYVPAEDYGSTCARCGRGGPEHRSFNRNGGAW